ncbi:nicotinamide-nucleotide amidase [Intestinibacter bartlettii DSM 16795]|uniref:competence/damage-inducible protein A n=1 Tax=Intestinibacter bartlettii TaxID=261299 RepID=UPI000163177B|nr:competence/damage-inducible protein A [Intestinibacter bartlettii]EDQ96323.1 competence/damage-inducible domain protein CinA [Intestinibacter bartlettii DSM 16795]UWO82256.1 competence/damage-inducible protein A [Intestinibacter bartlettii]CUO77780.1 competence damage-inducible protein A [Intestinibacter bartlettii]SKA52389.1 nicotinamide-nucleotide amidase [Intestinibacter bartlettii DSM 16795]
MKAEIITVGTEILLGDILNTNCRYLSRELAAMGIEMYYQITVGDNEERLLKTLEESLNRSDIVICTGGLGPTEDDITKEVCAKYFGYELELHKPSLDAMIERFKHMNRVPTKNNEKQAYFPKEAYILKNDNGTAPGCIMEKEGKMIVVLPGPPKEMESMFENYVKPYLSKLTDDVIESEVLRIIGVGESKVENDILDIIDSQTNPTIATYAKGYECTLRITAKAKSVEEAKELIKPMSDEMKRRFGQSLYATGETSIEEVVAKMLVENNLKIAVAESCTGGMVSASLINYPGISSVFMEGCVTYSNEAKMKSLGVKKETLDVYGAVSDNCAKEMASGVAARYNTNVGIATTGIAGPGGGTDEKPVGLVYFGIYINGKVITKKYVFNGDRQGIRERATRTILNDLRLELLNMEK